MLLKRQIRNLEKITRLAAEVLTEARDAAPRPTRARRIRRSGKQLIAFRNLIRAERKKGVPAVDLAKKHGISTAYIYSIQ